MIHFLPMFQLLYPKKTLVYCFSHTYINLSIVLLSCLTTCYVQDQTVTLRTVWKLHFNFRDRIFPYKLCGNKLVMFSFCWEIVHRSLECFLVYGIGYNSCCFFIHMHTKQVLPIVCVNIRFDISFNFFDNLGWLEWCRSSH